MSKFHLLQHIIAQLEADLSVMKAAAADAKENATGEETKSDGKYDTRAIEASYLAGAQTERVAALAEALRVFQSFDPPVYGADEAVGPGALVETEHNGEIAFYLLAPAGGGVTVEHDGFDCTVLTPESRLYQQLLDVRSGEIVDDGSLMVLALE